LWAAWTLGDVGVTGGVVLGGVVLGGVVGNRVADADATGGGSVVAGAELAVGGAFDGPGAGGLVLVHAVSTARAAAARTARQYTRGW
jgi:hypothetical protein